MNVDLLANTLAELNQPAFRLAQAKRAFFVELLGSWAEVTPFPKPLREQLAERVPWSSLTPVQTVESSRGDTVKTLFSTADLPGRQAGGNKIEAVLMRHEGGRNTVCISSQIGCAMACAFCATGTMGWKRNLTAEEMVDQVLHFSRRLKGKAAHVTNVVFMGMGEPLNNYDEVMKAVRILNDPDGICLGARHITISTCGLVPGIRRLAKEPIQINLAISLHSAIDATRSDIMPVNKAFPVRKLMEAVDEYAERTNRKVFFEYLLLKGVNDTKEEAEALVNLLGHNKRLYHVNLIKYHDTDMFDATDREARVRFMHWLQRRGMPVTHRISFGEDIDAACGQLAVNDAAGMLAQGKLAVRANRKTKPASAAALEVRERQRARS
ncbi:23S rRNA (adenine(2503)-C(2))-methyltransferase RlmN [Candidatus Uhrbacteria bacterium]|nr:23S rRNA (adenine(2503)-C(2))-methyltransferase RlmN [Candidatus Uhrbacteria bacterium]